MKKPWIINIVGRSGSGKTTLIEALVGHFTGLGNRVSAVKSMRHDFEIDYPGKDSHRYREAGATVSIITNREKFAVVGDLEPGISPVDLAIEQCSGSDIIIIEGFREGDSVKIEVIGDAAEEPLCTSGISNIKILVTDNSVQSDLPVYRRNDITGIAAALEELRKNGKDL